IHTCDLSFSFYSRDLISYKGWNLGNPFSPRKNLFSKKSYQLFMEIIRFNNLGKNIVLLGTYKELFGDFLKKNAFTALFIEGYLYPLMTILWSCPFDNLYELPTDFVLMYLKQNGLLETLGSPTWYFLRGGALAYTEPLTQDFRQNIHLNTPVIKILRDKYHITLQTQHQAYTFDTLILATQADQALKLLQNPSPLERHLLSSFKYVTRNVYLHTDKTVMPPQKQYWAALNYINKDKQLLTYHANRVQKFVSKMDYFITMHEGKPIIPGKIVIKTTLNRPQYTAQNIANQARFNEINGILNTYYCGSYWGHGTLEDAVKSVYRALLPLQTVESL
ncbi:MAG TPA: FAD-dependent oxidoreductase, partial [Gammaproteobacteria bacterium]|nr:FAD-dependent oxidoreductase [Gammaproteobacteria bacterium]